MLGNCQAELAGCIADLGCLQNLVCLNSCNGAPDITACQLRCGDLYEDKAVTTFNSCALSRKQCVAQRVDANLFPVPPDCALDTSFDLSKFTGTWNITAGLNPLFDTFNCQVHKFSMPEPGKLVGEINWRIAKGGPDDGDFLQRSTTQTFVQQENPAILWNHGNQYLHYEDDWYVIASKPDEYVFIYYKGNNDAWKGYGGAVVYTRAASLPQEYVPELRKAAEAAGVDWDKMKLTDNTCKPASESSNLSPNFEGGLKSFGKGFTVVENEILGDLDADARAVARKISDAEELIKLLTTELEEGVVAEEKVLEEEVISFETWLGNTFKQLFGLGDASPNLK